MGISIFYGCKFDRMESPLILMACTKLLKKVFYGVSTSPEKRILSSGAAQKTLVTAAGEAPKKADSPKAHEKHFDDFSKSCRFAPLRKVHPPVIVKSLGI